MTLDMIEPKTKKEDLLLSIAKNCETLKKQNYAKPQETIEFKLTKPRETFSFEPSINVDLDSNWLVGLTNLEVYNSIFNLTEKITNSNFIRTLLTNFHLKK